LALGMHIYVRAAMPSAYGFEVSDRSIAQNRGRRKWDLPVA
jgi:hypothetical protein